MSFGAMVGPLNFLNFVYICKKGKKKEKKREKKVHTFLISILLCHFRNIFLAEILCLQDFKLNYQLSVFTLDMDNLEKYWLGANKC